MMLLAEHVHSKMSKGEPGTRLHPRCCQPELTGAACRIYRRREYKNVAQGILKRAAANAARVVVGLAASSIGECSSRSCPVAPAFHLTAATSIDVGRCL